MYRVKMLTSSGPKPAFVPQAPTGEAESGWVPKPLARLHQGLGLGEAASVERSPLKVVP
jgi:hypothetical protein